MNGESLRGTPFAVGKSKRWGPSFRRCHPANTRSCTPILLGITKDNSSTLEKEVRTPEERSDTIQR